MIRRPGEAHRNEKYVVERRKVEKAYLSFVKASQKFYREWILTVQVYFGFPELEVLAKTALSEHASRKPMSHNH
jgi:Telomerase activating protein Est1